MATLWSVSSATTAASSFARHPQIFSRLNIGISKEVTCLSFGGVSSQVGISLINESNHRILTQAVAEALTQEPSVEVEDGLDEVSKLKLESDLLKKKAKRAELRRKRLVRKRHLRKKGRWPPSKMAKLKNV